MWTAPPPAWNQTVPGSDEANIKTALIQVLNGSTNVVVKWSYNILDKQSIALTIFSIDKNTFGAAAGGESDIYEHVNDYGSRFNIKSTSEFSSLTISTVTERENAIFRCKLKLTDNTKWAYNIRIEVTGIKSMILSAKVI